MNITLATLPPELLSQIVTYIETARTLSHLGRTCKKLQSFVDQDGFRVFVQARFPYLQPPAVHPLLFWRDAAHGLTTLSRNWERKAFLAWNMKSPADTKQDSRRQRAYFRSGQTMGFVPVLDSYETWHGGDWSSRKEVVAWGAGAGLIMRIKSMGNKAKTMSTDASKDLWHDDLRQHKIRWTKYHEKGAAEGRDDITSLNILPQRDVDGPEQMVIGRASGGLSLIGLSTNSDRPPGEMLASYVTKGRPVRSATINPTNTLLAACLTDSDIAVYNLSSRTVEVSPSSEASIAMPNPTGSRGRTWSSRFLRHDLLAVGHGPSETPIRIYRIDRGGSLDGNSRSLRLANAETRGHVDDPVTSRNNVRSDDLVTSPSDTTSVYSLAPVPVGSLAGGLEGDLFLSGAYDGFTRLHDLRTRNAMAAIFRDPVDTFSPVYSLLPVGTERFVAGGGRHSMIKVFDLRMPGDRLYYEGDHGPCSTAKNDRYVTPILGKGGECCYRHYEAKNRRRNWNLFLNIQDRSRRDSPVYALSRPSQSSTSFFAGIESHIVQFDMVSVMDKHPDPIYGKGTIQREPHDNVVRDWDPDGEVLFLPMYEHSTGPVNLIKQRAEVHASDKPIRPGWDERWSSGSRR